MSITGGLLGLSKLKLAGAVVGVLVLSILGGFAVGVLGAPTVEQVDNRFGEVTDETTIIDTDLLLHNPNPIGVQLGGTTINYTVRMNDVPMAVGGREGLDIDAGNSTLSVRTAMDNGAIPEWWRTHVNNGERTVVTINATVHTSLLGERQFDITQEQEVRTNIIGQFNSNETRPIRSDNPPLLMSNPVLYVNRTAAEWGQATAERTPIDMEFALYNPQTFPYAISELGYEITMNGVLVGEGRTDDVATILPGATETVRTRAAILNPNLDDWWVTHLQNDQRTELTIEFYAVISSDTLSRDLRIPLDQLTYRRMIETDIFGNKNRPDDGGGGTPTPAGGNGTPTPGRTPTPTSTPVDPLPDASPTATDDSII